MYAVVDIETTGGSPVSEKITEIAIFIHDGNKIVREYATLINPERSIPYYITQLTGITNNMVADAPKFYEIAKDIIEITEGNIFVAHNVNFDYSFIKQEFKQLGYNFSRKKMCTVKLSRRIIPGHRSYSLGKLCNDLGIKIEGRHRASGDALATTKLLEILLSKNREEFLNPQGIKEKEFHPNLDPKQFDTLPEEPGVYYFYNDRDDLIYIGKSKNIRTRVLSHFRNLSTKKAIEMRDAIANIDFEATGCELIALLKESQEIKEHKPRYNRAQRRSGSHFGLYQYTDVAGYIRFELVRLDKETAQAALCSFNSLKAGKNYLQSLVTRYNLCQKLCGLYKTNGACFSYEIMECKGACVGKESPSDYNIRAYKIIEAHKYKHNNFYIIEKGRNNDEVSVIKVSDGIYLGYGYLDRNEFNGNLELLSDCIAPMHNNRDVQQILRSYLRNGKPIDLIPFVK